MVSPVSLHQITPTHINTLTYTTPQRLPFFGGQKPVKEGNEVPDGTGDDAAASNEKSQIALPMRPGPNAPEDETTLRLHPLPNDHSLLLKVQTPAVPAEDIEHVPCDIVLVIDVSGSMSAAAPTPGEGGESTGLSVLDLVRHAANTIIETLDDNDRLGIVTFGSKSQIIQSLIPMTKGNKDVARDKVKSMRSTDATNLWHGILDGFKVFKAAKSPGRAAAMMVLTDGQPNHMCPPAGYVPKMRAMMPFPTTIHTFGFGYTLKSGLLKSIAEIGNGNYAFIPDAGMIGTVFVHAVANLQSTYATNATVTLTYKDGMDIETAMGASVIQGEAEKIKGKKGLNNKLTIHLGNLQYGQSRDVVLRVVLPTNSKDKQYLSEKDEQLISALLNADRISLDPNYRVSPLSISVTEDFRDASSLPKEEIDYHESRARICRFLSDMFPILANGEHQSNVVPDEDQLEQLIQNIPAKDHKDAKNVSLMDDLTGEDPKGQISIAIKSSKHFDRWGLHYLPSYQNAHTRQICNSFKDSGPLQYGTESTLFKSCRDKLDTAFDDLPAPEPTGHAYSYGAFYNNSPSHGGTSGGNSDSRSRKIKMSSYNVSSGPCFAGSTPVKLASGQTVRMKQLRRGMAVQTPSGMRRVNLVLKTPVRGELICRVGDLLVTPWHPISFDAKDWHFPADIADRAVRYTGSVYSVLLQEDEDIAAHAVNVAGVWGVALGHGVVSGEDVRAHGFLGNYAKVRKSLDRMGVRRGGVVLGGGVKRDVNTGQVNGFKARK